MRQHVFRAGGAALLAGALLAASGPAAGAPAAAGAWVQADEPEAYRVFQRAAGAADVPLSGTYGGPAPPAAAQAVEARAVRHGTSEAVTRWIVVDPAPADGAWHGTLRVPQGGWYDLQVRLRGGGGPAAFAGDHPWGVGILVGVLGQSNLDLWWSPEHSGHTLEPDPLAANRTPGRGWRPLAAETGDGATAFADALIAATGVPVGLLAFARDGAALVPEADAGLGVWLDTAPCAVFDTFATAVAAAGGRLELVLWAQGEREARAGVGGERYREALAVFLARLHAVAGPDAPVLLSLLGRGERTGRQADDPQRFQAIRDAQEAACAADPLCHIGATTVDLPLHPDPQAIHYAPAAYITHARRLAAAALHRMGRAPYGRGPTPAAWRLTGTTVEVRLSSHGSRGLVPPGPGGYTGWEVLEAGAPLPIRSVTPHGDAAVRIELARPPAGPLTVRHLYGNAPDASRVARTAGPLPLPVEGRSAIPRETPVAAPAAP